MVPGRTAERGGQAGHQRRQFGVGHGQQQQLGAAGDLVDGQHRGVGQPALRRAAGTPAISRCTPTTT